MADYHPLIARAVAALEKNTGEARRVLYDRARKALVEQLRSAVPALNESDITHERLALEEAIRKVEAEVARQSRLESQTPPASTPAPVPSPARTPTVVRAVESDRREASSGERSRPEPVSSEGAAVRGQGGQVRRLPRARPSTAREPAEETGLKGFRDVVAEAETLGGATAQASKSAREKFAAVPSPGREFERIEPHHEPEGLRPASRELIPSHVRETPFSVRAVDTPDDDDRPPIPFRSRVDGQGGLEIEEPAGPGRPPSAYVKIAIVLVLALGLAGAGYWQRSAISGLFGRVGPAIKGPGSSTPQEASQPQRKITDRIGASPQPNAGKATRSAAPPQEQVAPVAQRVVLYEEDPENAAGKRFVGSVIWRTEKVSPGPGQPSDLGIRADLEIPERRITVTWSLRRNSDKTLPASHTVEIMFSVPADFPHGGIANVPGLLMKQAEQTRGIPLAGLAVKVTTGFFLIGLSAVDTDRQRNIQLLKERPWFDIPIVYNDGRRAILAVEKGTPGERVFQEAFAAWGE